MKEQPLQKRISVLNKVGGADFAKLLANKVIPPEKGKREENEEKEEDKNKIQKKEDIKIEQKPAQKRVSAVMNKVGGGAFAKLLAGKLNNPNRNNPPNFHK